MSGFKLLQKGKKRQPYILIRTPKRVYRKEREEKKTDKGRLNTSTEV